MKIQTITLKLFIFIKIAYSFTDIKLMEEFFIKNAIRHANIIGCFRKVEQIEIIKNFITKFALNLNINNLQDFNKIGSYFQSDRVSTAILLDGDCEDSHPFLIQCGPLKLFDVKHTWLIQSTFDNIFELFENVEININARIHVAIKKGPCWPLMDVYNPAFGKGGRLQVRQVGCYSPQTHEYQENYLGNKYWIRKNMTGVQFKTDVVLPVNFKGTLLDYLASNENREVNTFNRFHSRLMSFCRDYYNFSVDIRVTKSWGYKKDAFHFDGLVGDLENHVVDFGYSPLFVRTDRATVMQYGRRTWILRAAFLFRNPKAKSSAEAYFKPLSLTIWLCTLFSGLLAILVLKVSLLYERNKFHTDLDITWSSLILNTIGAFCQQGAMGSPNLLCGRIVTIFIFLLSILIYQFYSASIVSNLLQKPQTNIRTVEEILLSPMRAGCEDILYNRDYFLYTTDESSKKLYSEKIMGKKNTSNFIPPEEGLHQVELGNYAFHVELATAYPIIRDTFGERATCDLREVQMYPTQPMHANLQKNSPFLDMVNFCLHRLAENGLLHREIAFWHPRKPECIQTSKSVVFNVGLDDFYPALMTLFIGMVFSWFIFSVELLTKVKMRVKFIKVGTVYPYTN